MSRLIILIVVLYIVFELYRYLMRVKHRARFQPHSTPDTLIAKADKAFRAEQFHEARTYLQRAKILDDKSAEICNKLGVVQERLGEYDEALKEFKQALHSDADNENTHLEVADLLSRMQRFDEARVHYARAIEIDAASEEAHFRFARMLESAGETARACEKYRKTLQLNPAYAEAKAALARCGG